MSVTRAQRHAHHQGERLAMAVTPEERMSAAFDWCRSSLRRLGRRRAGSAEAQRAERALRDRLTREVTVYLERVAEASEKGCQP